MLQKVYMRKKNYKYAIKKDVYPREKYMQQKLYNCYKNNIYATKNYICKKIICSRIFGKLNLVCIFNIFLKFLRKQS